MHLGHSIVGRERERFGWRETGQSLCFTLFGAGETLVTM